MTPRGGKRKGAGRPKLGEVPRVMSAFSLPPALVEWITEQAEAQGTSRSELVARILEDARRGGPRAAGASDALADLRSVAPLQGGPEFREIALPASAWLRLDDLAEQEGHRRPIGRIAGELLALGLAASEILARQEPES